MKPRVREILADYAYVVSLTPYIAPLVLKTTLANTSHPLPLLVLHNLLGRLFAYRRKYGKN